MDDFEKEPGGLDDILRAVGRHVSDSIDRALTHADVEDVADFLGVEPERAREWAESAGGWLRSQAEAAVSRAAEQAEAASEQLSRLRAAEPSDSAAGDPFRAAAPHPLDTPSREQGTALAALDSGRWTVEPGSGTLAASSEGPGPSDALGLARELRARDWLSVDGQLTVAGRHALSRWLSS